MKRKRNEGKKRMPMYLWVLACKHPDDPRWGYDCADKFVVRASSEMSARKLVHGSKEVGLQPGDEGRDVWLHSEVTTCELLSSQGPQAIIMRDFNAG